MRFKISGLFAIVLSVVVLSFVTAGMGQKPVFNPVTPNPPLKGPVAVASADVDKDLIAKGCQYYLGRKSEYLCKSETAYQSCFSYLKKGAVNFCGWGDHALAMARAGSAKEAEDALKSAGCKLNAQGLWDCPASKEYVCVEYRNGGGVKGCVPHCHLSLNSGSRAFLANGKLNVLLFFINGGEPGGCTASDLGDISLSLPYGGLGYGQLTGLDPQVDPKAWGNGVAGMSDLASTPPDWFLKKCANPPPPGSKDDPCHIDLIFANTATLSHQHWIFGQGSIPAIRLWLGQSYKK